VEVCVDVLRCLVCFSFGSLVLFGLFVFVFGPVVCVYGYDDVDQAISQANSLPYAFQASVLTQNMDFGLRCSQRLDAATVMINDHTAYRVDWMPFAGIRQSGLGVGGIPYTFEDMQIDKQIVIRSKEL